MLEPIQAGSVRITNAFRTPGSDYVAIRGYRTLCLSEREERDLCTALKGRIAQRENVVRLAQEAEEQYAEAV